MKPSIATWAAFLTYIVMVKGQSCNSKDCKSCLSGYNCVYIYNLMSETSECIQSNAYQSGPSLMPVYTLSGCMSTEYNNKITSRENNVNSIESTTPGKLHQESNRYDFNITDLIDELLVCHQTNQRNIDCQKDLCDLQLQYNNTMKLNLLNINHLKNLTSNQANKISSLNIKVEKCTIEKDLAEKLIVDLKNNSSVGNSLYEKRLSENEGLIKKLKLSNLQCSNSTNQLNYELNMCKNWNTTCLNSVYNYSLLLNKNTRQNKSLTRRVCDLQLLLNKTDSDLDLIENGYQSDPTLNSSTIKIGECRCDESTAQTVLIVAVGFFTFENLCILIFFAGRKLIFGKPKTRQQPHEQEEQRVQLRSQVSFSNINYREGDDRREQFELIQLE